MTHKEIAEQIIRQGNCNGLICSDCPFDNDCSDRATVALAQQYLGQIEEQPKVSTTFRENLICSILSGLITDDTPHSIKANKNMYAETAIMLADEVIKQMGGNNE